MENSIENLKIQIAAKDSSAVSSRWITGSMQQKSQMEPPDSASDVERKFQRRVQKLNKILAEIKIIELDSLEEMRDIKMKLQIHFEIVEEANNIHLKIMKKDLMMEQIEEIQPE